MVKSLILTKEADDKTVKTYCIYFSNEELAMHVIDFLKIRYDLSSVDKLIQKSLDNAQNQTKYSGIDSWMINCNHTYCMISLASISCKNYKDQPIIYRLEISDKNTKTIQLSDLFTDKSTADKLANIINQNSDSLVASVTDIMVINASGLLETFEQFLISDKSIGDQWEYFSNIHP